MNTLKQFVAQEVSGLKKEQQQWMDSLQQQLQAQADTLQQLQTRSSTPTTENEKSGILSGQALADITLRIN